MIHFSRLLAVAVFLCVAPALAAVDRPAVERDFRAWIEADLWPRAKARGISRATFDKARPRLKLDWSLPDLRPPGAPAAAAPDYSQAEFRSPAAYFKESQLDSLARTGRGHLARWADTLTAIEKRYGVPRRILVAIWAKESAYGRASIPHNALTVLATQAYMGRRKDFFRAELVAALRIVEEGHVGVEALRSSWAGALGQPQFLPSKFFTHAADFDGDGRRDIWGSVPDTLASIAHYLAREGWQAGRDWGFEATVPPAVSCALEGPDKGKPIADWVAAGVKRVSGRPFPAPEMARTGFLMMPAGRAGPAWIATKNFYTLKSFNESDLYALYIGHLADRFSANRPFAGRWRTIGHFSRRAVQQMQKRLEARGQDVGGADGLVGFKTRVAVGRWQAENGMAPACFPDAGLVERIR